MKIISEFNKIIKSKKIIIIYFYSEECENINKIVENLININKANVNVKKYDINDTNNEALIKLLNIKSYPFFYIYKDNKLVDQILGSLNIKLLLNLYINI